MLKKLRKGIVILPGVVVVLFAAMFIALSIFNSPTYAWRILRYGQSDIGDYKIFPERAISNGTKMSMIEKGGEYSI